MAKIIVVGAGLVGTVMATYLVKLGHDVSVWDKRTDPRETESLDGSSVNLTLCERGFASLARVGLDLAIRGRSVPVNGRLIHDCNGRLTFQPYGTLGQAIYSISRAELHRLLLDHAEQQCDIRFVFGSRCVGIDPHQPAVTFTSTGSGTTFEERADVVLGADGVHSVIRSQLQRQRIVTYKEEELEQGYKELDIRASGDQGWVAHRNVLHLWPRETHMLLAFPNANGSFTGSLHLPFYGDVSFDSIRSPADLSTLFEESFQDALPYVSDLVRTFFARPTNLMMTIRCSPWHADGKVVLLGDAAHALYPVYGQGANAGFEDCRILTECLVDAAGKWSIAFHRYSTMRERDLNAMADLCKSHVRELRKDACDPSFQLRKVVERKVAEVLGDRYRPLYTRIAFSLSSYADAVDASRHQEAIVDRLMGVENLEAKLPSSEFDWIVHNEAASLTEHASRLPQE